MTKLALGYLCRSFPKRISSGAKCVLRLVIVGLVIWNATGVISQTGTYAQTGPPTTVTMMASSGAQDISQDARAAATSVFIERCAVCHGPNGDGTGPGAVNLNPKPTNFRNLRWQRSVTDETIAKVIVYGGQSVGLSASMSPNPDLETQPKVVAALVEHVRQIGKKHRR